MARVTLGGMIASMKGIPGSLQAHVRRELLRVGSEVRDTAMKKFGTYQPAVGPYNEWKQLADVTLRRKAKAGAPSDMPLIGYYLSTWKRKQVYGRPLRQSIEFYVDGWQVHIGTNNPLGDIHEHGRGTVPPRPWLRPAAWQNQSYFVARMKQAWANAALGFFP